MSDQTVLERLLEEKFQLEDRALYVEREKSALLGLLGALVAEYAEVWHEGDPVLEVTYHQLATLAGTEGTNLEPLQTAIIQDQNRKLTMIKLVGFGGMPNRDEELESEEE